MLQKMEGWTLRLCIVDNETCKIGNRDWRWVDGLFNKKSTSIEPKKLLIWLYTYFVTSKISIVGSAALASEGVGLPGSYWIKRTQYVVSRCARWILRIFVHTRYISRSQKNKWLNKIQQFEEKQFWKRSDISF